LIGEDEGRVRKKEQCLDIVSLTAFLVKSMWEAALNEKGRRGNGRQASYLQAMLGGVTATAGALKMLGEKNIYKDNL